MTEFRIWCFQILDIEWTLFIMIKILQKSDLYGVTDIKWKLIKLTAWCQKANKSMPKPKMTYM